MARRIVTDIYRELHIIILAQSTRTPQFIPQRRLLIERFLDEFADIGLADLHRLRAYCQAGAGSVAAGELAFALALELPMHGLQLDSGALVDDMHLTPVLHYLEPAWPMFFCINVAVPLIGEDETGSPPARSDCRLDLAIGKKTAAGEPLVGAVQFVGDSAFQTDLQTVHAPVPYWRLREAAFYADPAAAAESLLRWVDRL
jgi:hypothetical protein